MKVTTYLKRRDAAEILAKAMFEKAKERSKACVGKEDFAFIAGYLQSTLTSVACESPASMKRLAEMVNYKG